MTAVGLVCEGSSSQVLSQGFFHLAVSHGNYSQLPNKRQKFKKSSLELISCSGLNDLGVQCSSGYQCTARKQVFTALVNSFFDSSSVVVQ